MEDLVAIVGYAFSFPVPVQSKNPERVENNGIQE